MELGYLGPEGSHSYTAARLYAPNKNIVAMPSMGKIISAVEKNIISQGILPIENSTEGAVTQAMDALMQTETARIQGEVILQIRHHLLSTAGDPTSLRYVFSHPQALEQCREFFAQNYPYIELIPCTSTSQACKLAKEKGPKYGAIAKLCTGESNGLSILHMDIQDNVHNQTRFVVIGKKQTLPTGKDKTSIAFAFPNDSPGSLYKVLKVFADKGINLTRIESRPAKIELGKYIFYIDFHGHKQEETIGLVLAKLKKMTSRLKVFGSYPRGKVF